MSRRADFWSRCARLASALGAPGAIIGSLSLVACGVSLAVLRDEHHHPTQTGQAALHQLFEGWVRSDDYLGYTLIDRVERWSRAEGAERERALEFLRRAVAALGRTTGGDDPRFRVIRVTRLVLAPASGPPLAAWHPEPDLGPDPALGETGTDRVVVAGGSASAAVDLVVGYQVDAPVLGAIQSVEASYHRLLLALLGLSGYSLLCLGYMARHALTLGERAAREAAASATLDLADRTCHELGNVAFVVANERRNLAAHIDLLERFVAEDAEALESATRRAGIDEAAAARLVRALRREYAVRGIDPELELKGSAAIAREVCQRIATCSDYIALTVRELDGHLRHADASVELEAVRLDEVITDALALLAPRIEASGLTIAVDQPPEPIVVRADRRHLIHALVNLTKNAIEAVATGTDAAPGPSSAPPIRIVAALEDTQGSLAVVDRGPGIDPHRLRRVFRPGFTTKSTGRGLGLAIVRESVLAQGGTLDVTSQTGLGTTFTIRLSRVGPEPS